MKVIRQICYECDEPDNLRAQLARSMPEGKREGWAGGVSIEVRTVYSELPELEPFVPLQGEEAKEFLRAMLEIHGCRLCDKLQPCPEHGRTPVTAEDFEQLTRDVAEEPRVAHSMSEYRRLVAQGVDVKRP